MKKTNPRRIVAILAALALIFCLTGCDSTVEGNQPPQKETSSQGSGNGSASDILSGKLDSVLNNQNTPSSSPDDAAGKDISDPSYLSFIEQMQQNGMIAGVAFLGYIDGPMGDGYRGFLAEEGYLEEYPFIAEIPTDRYIETDGNELYCIVPADPSASVAVNEWIVTDGDPDNGQPGEVLYRSESGEPILLLCNDEAVWSNLQINLVDGKGNIASFHPFVSPENYRLSPGEAAGDIVDFTIYANGKMDNYYFEQLTEGSPELLGTWAAWDAYDINGEQMVCSLSFYQDESGANRMEYFYGPPESEIHERFEGSYYMPDIASDNITQDMVMFDMELVGGLAIEEGIEPYHFGGVYLILYYPELDVIDVIHMEGSPLLYGMDNAIITFERSVG